MTRISSIISQLGLTYLNRVQAPSSDPNTVIADMYEAARRPAGGNSNSSLVRQVNEMQGRQCRQAQEVEVEIARWRTEVTTSVNNSCNVIETLLSQNRFPEAESEAAAQEYRFADALANCTIDSSILASIQQSLQSRIGNVRAEIGKSKSDFRINELQHSLERMQDEAKTSRNSLSSQLSDITKALDAERAVNNRAKQDYIDAKNSAERAQKLAVYQNQMKTTVRQPNMGSQSTTWTRPRITPGRNAHTVANAIAQIFDGRGVLEGAMKQEMSRADVASLLISSPIFENTPTLQDAMKAHLALLEQGSVTDEYEVCAKVTRNIADKLRAFRSRVRLTGGTPESQASQVRPQLMPQLKQTLALNLAPSIKD